MSSQARPLANFSPSMWGDEFSSIPRDIKLWQEYSKERDVLKEEVRSLLLSSDGKWTDKLKLINAVERLGVSYHFTQYIEEKVTEMYEKMETEEYHDLFTTALYFRVFRQHGHKISSEVFNKYKEIDGKFGEGMTKDAAGILSLYEAAQLRTHGEAVLDEALDFTTSQLKCMVRTLESGLLARQVMRALKQPSHKGILRIEAKQFISFYEEDPSKNQVLLKFAKLDFNLVQMLYKQELSHVTRWWADLQFDSKLPEFRSRVVEAYFWAVAISFEPCYSLVRIMYAKMICAITVADDLYDAYGTTDELDIYTKAIARMDVDSMEELTGYSRMCYKIGLNVFREFEEELIKNGRYYDVSCLIEAFKTNLRCYHTEATWRDKNWVPPFQDYHLNGATSSGICMLGISVILGMGKVDAINACDWVMKKPKAVFAAEAMGRTINDIVDFEEDHRRPHVATSIDCYTKEYGVSKEEAITALYNLIEDKWRDINEAYLRPTPVPIHYIDIFLNAMRICDVTYKAGDGYTHPEEHLKNEIYYMLLEPQPM